MDVPSKITVKFVGGNLLVVLLAKPRSGQYQEMHAMTLGKRAEILW